MSGLTSQQPLESFAFFAALEPECRARLDSRVILRQCRSGQVLFYKGELPAHLVCILDGYLKLIKVDDQGREIVIRFLGPGGVTGFRPMLAGEPSAAVAECVTGTHLALLPRQDFLQMVDESASFARSLLRMLSHELKESEERWLQRTSGTAEDRVRRFLAQLCLIHPQTMQGEGVHITVPKREIAMAADITPFTLSRILSRLAEQGCLVVESRSIWVEKPQVLISGT